jgi:hypothetical protein
MSENKKLRRIFGHKTEEDIFSPPMRSFVLCTLQTSVIQLANKSTGIRLKKTMLLGSSSGGGSDWQGM